MFELLLSLRFNCVVGLFVRFKVIVGNGVEVEIIGKVVVFCFWGFVN